MSEKKNGISIANIIAIIGLAGIGVLSFFGLYFKSLDGKPAIPALLAVAIVAGLSLFLILTIKAKGAKDNPDKWIWVEIACLVAYLAVAVLCARPFQHFFYVMSEKSNLQELASADLQKVDSLYLVYNQQKDEYMKNAAQQLKNVQDSGQKFEAGDQLGDYISGIVGSDIEEWMDDADLQLKLRQDEKLAQLKKQVKAWKLLELPQIAAGVPQKVSDAWAQMAKKLEQNEQHNLIPVIRGGDGYYFWGGYAEIVLPEQPATRFDQAIRGGDMKNIVGWIIYAVLNLLILLNYLVAPRNRFVGPRKGASTHSNGLDL